MSSTTKKTLLDNGIRIVTESLPGRTVSVGIWVDVGSRDENCRTNGTAHFVEHMLFKGTACRNAGQIAQELDGLGGASNAFTSKDSTCLYATVLDSQLPQLMDIYADLFLHSQFNDDEVERERSVILQEIDSVEDAPDDLIHELFSKLIWEGSPLSQTVLGQRQIVAAISSENLKEFIAELYLPKKIIIAAAGHVDHDNFVTMIEKQFSSLGDYRFAKNEGNQNPREVPLAKPPKRQNYIKPLEQEHMVLGTYGLAARSSHLYALSLLNVVLGGNMSSRLFQEVRERRGLAYSVFSFIESNLDCGDISIYTGVNPKTSRKTLAIIEKIVDTLGNGTITAEELLRAKGYARASLYLGAENMDSRMLRLVRNEHIFNRPISFAEVDADIAKVSLLEVNSLAEQLFTRPLSGVFLGPLQEIGGC